MRRNTLIAIVIVMAAILLLAVRFMDLIPALLTMAMVGLAFTLWAWFANGPRRNDHLYDGDGFDAPDARRRRYDGL